MGDRRACWAYGPSAGKVDTKVNNKDLIILGIHTSLTIESLYIAEESKGTSSSNGSCLWSHIITRITNMYVCQLSYMCVLVCRGGGKKQNHLGGRDK